MKHKVLKKHLKEGNIIPVWLNWKHQLNYRGDAVLIERVQKDEPPDDQKIYEFCEIGDSSLFDRKKDKITVLYSYQCWIIQFVTGKDKGFRTKAKIGYYKSTFYNRYIET